MHSTQKELGNHYERLAESHLVSKGLILVERNFLCRMGEIDLVMKHNECLVFVEVRFRKHQQYGNPLETITRSKQRKLIKAAQFYLKKHNMENAICRFDAIGISNSENGNLQIDWVPHAFCTT